MRAAKNLDRKCNLPTVNAERIESYVLGSIQKYFMFPENIIPMWQERVDVDEAKKLEAALRGRRTRLGNLSSRRDRLLELYLDGQMDKDYLKKQESQLKQTIDRAQEEITQIEEKLSEITTMKDRLDELKGITHEIKKFAPALNEAFKKMTNSKKQSLSRQLWGETKF